MAAPDERRTDGEKVVFLATDGVEEVELVAPRKAVEQAGAETVISA